MTFCLFIGLAYVSALVPTVFLLPRLGLGRRVRLIVSSAFFLVASRFLVSYLLTGSFSRPPWPGPVVLTWAFLDSTLMAFFLLQLPAYLFFRRLTLRRRRIVAVVLAIAAPCITAAGFLNVGCVLDRNTRIGGYSGHLDAPNGVIPIHSDMTVPEYLSAALNSALCAAAVAFGAVLCRNEERKPSKMQKTSAVPSCSAKPFSAKANQTARSHP